MTKVIKVDPRNIDPFLIREAAAIIRKGGLVAFPTETVYGLGANVFDEDAVKKIFAVKGRRQTKPLAVCVSNQEQLASIVQFVSNEAKELIAHFLPGPLTLVMPKKDTIPSVVAASGSTVGVRYPRHEIALALIDSAGVPIATTSANISGHPSPSTAQEVLVQLSNKIDLVIDGGPAMLNTVSTVLDLTSSPHKILREGALSKREIDHFLEQKKFLPLDA